LLAKGMSLEQIIKDFSEYFRSLLLIKKGVKSENVLGEQVSSFPPEIINAFNEEQLETALDMFLNLYRDIRYSLNPRFELELAISKLSKLRYVASTASVIEQLARLKNDLINGTITPLNPVLADMKTIQPEASEPRPPVSEVREQPKQQETPVPEPQVQSPEPEPELQPKAPEQENTAIWTMETLSDALPHGTVSVENTDDGLVLVFNSRLFYQTAYRNLSDVKARIHKKTESEINIVLSYSEAQEQNVPEPEPEPQKPQPQNIPEQERPEPKPQAPSMSEEQKNLITDLMLCFDGREER
ncbi:MAG: hypothetical protein J5800_04445, partial [Spirochaetales bacterium]|nr:hypothetical protein [Spirochaetales bacterium]